MVRASSISNNGISRFFNKKVLVGLSIFIVLVLGLIWFLNRPNGNSDDLSVATSTTISKNISDNIAQLKYPVSQPEAIPTHFVRTNVEIISDKSSKTKCEEVLQNYQGSDDPDVAYIDIYSYASTCSYPRPDDAMTYSVGDYPGWVSNPEAKKGISSLFEIAVNQGMVRVESDLTAEQLKETLLKFVKFNTVPPKDSAEILVK
ncbi:MAG: hypothetical protein U0R17_00020 [Acidimicrobiia bacterium]